MGKLCVFERDVKPGENPVSKDDIRRQKIVVEMLAVLAFEQMAVDVRVVGGVEVDKRQGFGGDAVVLSHRARASAQGACMHIGDAVEVCRKIGLLMPVEDELDAVPGEEFFKTRVPAYLGGLDRRDGEKKKKLEKI